MIACDGCGKPGASRCDECTRYYRDLKRRGQQPACRCDGNNCSECADRGDARSDR